MTDTGTWPPCPPWCIIDHARHEAELGPQDAIAHQSEPTELGENGVVVLTVRIDRPGEPGTPLLNLGMESGSHDDMTYSYIAFSLEPGEGRALSTILKTLDAAGLVPQLANTLREMSAFALAQPESRQRKGWE